MHPLIGLASLLGVGVLAVSTYTPTPPPPRQHGAIPTVEIVNVTPLASDPTRLLATWRVHFPDGAAMAPAVTHAEPRHVLVQAGAMQIISDDQVSRIIALGEQVTIRAGAWHTFALKGAGPGQLLVSGVVTADTLHDACGAP